MRGLAMVGWLGWMLLAGLAEAEDCADWPSEPFFASAAVEAVVGCLHAGANANARDEAGSTALHLAARFNPSAAVIRTLIEAGASPNLRDKPGRTPLHLAAGQNSSVAVVEALIEAGADPNEPSGRGLTPLYLAAKANSEAVVGALIHAGADPGMRGSASYIPVSIYYLGDQLAAVVHRLRASAAQGNARAQYGLGVIYAEAFVGHQYGAQAAAWYRQAAGHGHAKARTRLDELISRRGYTSLHLATTRHSLVVAALRDGGDPAARDNAGNTALHLAASNTDDPAVFEALVGAGADANARDNFGDTPLHWAARYNTNPAVLAVLIDAGADPDAPGESDATPLHWAAWNNGGPAVLTLVNAGANPNARRRDGATPLHWAAWNDDVSVIPALLDAGANPDARDSSGDSPLYWTARYANLPAFFAFARNAQLLMSSDFDVYYRKNTLNYIRKNCTIDDIRPKFILHLVPVDKGALSNDRKQYGFDNFDFFFDEHGVRFDGQCVAVRKIPGYDIATIRTGQYIPGEGRRTWEATYHFLKD